ncbi:MAG: dTDP-4-dehydrorhamnose 3,5-epimerase [Hyphomicrobiaceae bacterium]
MRFRSTEFDGAWLIEPEPIRDDRGFFMRTFCTREFGELNLEQAFVQHSVSYSSSRGTIRGMHYQVEPHGEVKVVGCRRGAIWDVIIDLREGSRTFGSWQGFELSSGNRHQLYIPKGFAHGFQALTRDVEVSYLISTFHEPSAARGIRYDDPHFAVRWPLAVSALSARDRDWPDFSGVAIKTRAATAH